MHSRRPLPLLLSAILLTGCAHGPRSLISLDGSQTHDLSRVALITEDRDSPALLRGLDGVRLDLLRTPALANYAYVVAPGTHVFWLKGLPYGHPFIPQRVQCYVLRAELAQGARYVLREDEASKTARLAREGSNVTESTGDLVDEPWVFFRECQWR